VLARRSINMTKLESRPSRNLPWEYVFYADVEGDVALPSMVAALDELRAQTRMLEVLGSYPIIGERAGA
jgi:prephenate dehydratase